MICNCILAPTVFHLIYRLAKIDSTVISNFELWHRIDICNAARFAYILEQTFGSIGIKCLSKYMEPHISTQPDVTSENTIQRICLRLAVMTSSKRESCLLNYNSI